MTPFTYRQTENIFKAEDNLGFYCFNEFTILDDNLTHLTSSEIVDKVFKSEFFADRFIAPPGRIKKTPLNEHGPLLIDKLEFEDYSLNDLDSLKKKVAIYEMDENWGDDLRPFKALFAESIDHIEKKRLNENPIYYLNQEEIDDSKKIGLNYFTYFISLIIISLQTNKIILIDYGGD
jgi:hypothetical protein